ncbi:MAG: glycoside hydrolase family 88 protein [Verrucomicrobiota bacterium]|jgi:rhamnogalacturonyl hydrolase YesR
MKKASHRCVVFAAAIAFLTANFQLGAQPHAPDIITPSPRAPQNPAQLHERLEGALIMPLSPDIIPQKVLKAMQRVADWQLAHPATNPPTSWLLGAENAGMMALAGISGDAKYREAMRAAGEANDWRPGPQFYDADDYCVGQAYTELYFFYRENRMISPLRERFDAILAKPSDVPGLEFTKAEKRDRKNWSWCDSLFMGPPTWLRLYAATDDERYLDFAVTNWWRTTDYLYDKDEHLFFRDSTFFSQREANRQKVFWSRGNGWVLAGLVRVLQYLPMNHPDRPRFEQLFKEMAGKILACQQPDGLWRASLLDPASYPAKETSGSGFFTYAFAWGVNQGLLDRAKFEPAIRKAWAALVGCVEADGKLTHVQPVGGAPTKFAPDSTAPYGVGAFLLAGSEVYRLAVLEKTKPIAIKVTNPTKFRRECETVEVVTKRFHIDGSWINFPGQIAVMDGESSRVLDSQIYSLQDFISNTAEKLLFQVDLAPGETRMFYILDAEALAVVPPPIVKTLARYVPERHDDFAWESDRIAHRTYGLALIPAEGTISSGPDVWIKTWRNLMINEMYASGHYHMTNGTEMDDYRVGSSRGCGGVGIWDGQKLYVSSNYRNWKLITTGPIRSEFELTYDEWDAAGRKVSETKRYSIDAGSWFTKAQSTFASETNSPLTIGIGLAERACGPDGEELIAQDQAEGWMSYWQPEDKPKGTIGVAIILPKGSINELTNDNPAMPDIMLHAVVPQPTVEGAPPIRNLLAVTQVKAGQPFTYYFGACWDRSGDFTNHVAWENYVRRFAERRDAPLQVTMGN